MSAQPTHDLAIKSGVYQDRNGDTKGRWLRIGTVFRHDDGGTSIKLDAIPVGLPEWNGWVSVFKRELKEEGQAQTQHRQPPPQQRQQARPAPQNGPLPFDDDIPF